MACWSTFWTGGWVLPIPVIAAYLRSLPRAWAPRVEDTSKVGTGLITPSEKSDFANACSHIGDASVIGVVALQGCWVANRLADSPTTLPPSLVCNTPLSYKNYSTFYYFSLSLSLSKKHHLGRGLNKRKYVCVCVCGKLQVGKVWATKCCNVRSNTDTEVLAEVQTRWWKSFKLFGTTATVGQLKPRKLPLARFWYKKHARQTHTDSQIYSENFSLNGFKSGLATEKLQE